MPHGPTPRDGRDFGAAGLARLRRAAADLRYLLERGYGKNAALSLVGDRFRLTRRQRQFLYRCVSPPAAAAGRRARLVPPASLVGAHVVIDGYNCLIIAECALAGGVVLLADDGVLRDAQGVFGAYRMTEHTRTALAALLDVLRRQRPAAVTVYLDGRMRYAEAVCQEWSTGLAALGVPCRVSPVLDADRALCRAVAAPGTILASSDSRVMDAAGAVVDLPAAAAAGRPGLHLVRLDPDPG